MSARLRLSAHLQSQSRSRNHNHNHNHRRYPKPLLGSRKTRAGGFTLNISLTSRRTAKKILGKKVVCITSRTRQEKSTVSTFGMSESSAAGTTTHAGRQQAKMSTRAILKLSKEGKASSGSAFGEGVHARSTTKPSTKFGEKVLQRSRVSEVTLQASIEGTASGLRPTAAPHSFVSPLRALHRESEVCNGH